jgi:hypothetical protein
MLRTEWRVLFHLGRYGAMSAREISRRAGIHKTKVSRAVAALERKRFLERRESRGSPGRDPVDLRAPGRAAFRRPVRAAAEHETGAGGAYGGGHAGHAARDAAQAGRRRGRIAREIREGNPVFRQFSPHCPVTCGEQRVDLGPVGIDGAVPLPASRKSRPSPSRTAGRPPAPRPRPARRQSPPLNASPRPRVHKGTGGHRRHVYDVRPRRTRGTPARPASRYRPSQRPATRMALAASRSAGYIRHVDAAQRRRLGLVRGDVVAQRQHLVRNVCRRRRVEDRHRATGIAGDGPAPFAPPSNGCSSCVTKTFACAISAARASISSGEIVPADAGADDDRVVARRVVEKMKADPVGCSACCGRAAPHPPRPRASAPCRRRRPAKLRQ